jgi:small redox-active disulfide protein 2
MKEKAMKVKILGTGCMKCQRLYAEAARAVAESGREVALEKVEDVSAIMDYGVMVTPAIVVDEQVKASGRIPHAAEIAGWLEEAAKVR